jgi:hypothetical protein
MPAAFVTTGIILFATYQAEAVLAPSTAGLFLLAVLWPVSALAEPAHSRVHRARDHRRGNERRRSGFRIADSVGFHTGGPVGRRRCSALSGAL